MKTEVTETGSSLFIDMFPETVEEMAILLRATNNAKKTPPSIIFNFNGPNPSCYVELQKVDSYHRSNSISIDNNTRNK